MVCCKGKNNTQNNIERKVIKSQSYNFKISISVFIDSSYQQTNIIKSRVAQLLIKDGNATIRQASLSSTSGNGSGNFEVNSLVDFDIRLFQAKVLQRYTVSISEP